MVAERCQEQGIARHAYHFTRRNVREYTHWGNTQLKTHLRRLEDMEYLIVHRGGGRGRWLQYELQYDPRGAEGARRLAGLIDVDQLHTPPRKQTVKRGCSSNKSGGNGKKSAPNVKKSGQGRPQVGAKSARENRRKS